MHKYLKIAANLASSHDYEECLDYRLCAVIVRGGNIISVGYNKKNTNGFVEHYTDKVRGNDRDYCLSTHAEMSSILAARNKTDLSGCKIFVARIRPPEARQRLGLAKPCAICRASLSAYKIKRAYYTIDDDTYGVMNIVNKNKKNNKKKRK